MDEGNERSHLCQTVENTDPCAVRDEKKQQCLASEHQVEHQRIQGCE